MIEGDPGLARLMQVALRAEGHLVDVAVSGREGVALADRTAYDVILLDLLLRDAQETDVLLRLRQGGVTSPILAVGSRTGPADVIRALDAGADEYVTRPVGPDEIAARVRALMRRAAPSPPIVLASENVTLNIVTHQAFVNGIQLRLTPKESALVSLEGGRSAVSSLAQRATASTDRGWKSRLRIAAEKRVWPIRYIPSRDAFV